MKINFSSLILFIALVGFSFPQPEAQSIQAYPTQAQSIVQEPEKTETVTAFSVSVSALDAYVLNDIDEIQANGKRYLISDSPPVKVGVALLITEGDHKPWIVVRKVSGGRSIKLTPFNPSQFLFEHSDDGEYEVTSLDRNNEPVFDYFTIGDDEPDDPKPDDPKPNLPGDYKELIEVAQANSNSDIDTRKKLGTAWLSIVESNPATIDEAKKKIGVARENILSFVEHDGSWNKFLVAVDAWFKSKSLSREQYLEAMKELSRWMSQ